MIKVNVSVLLSSYSIWYEINKKFNRIF